MVFFQSRPDWQLSERQVTSEAAFWNRRQFMKTMAAAGLGFSTLSLGACQSQRTIDPKLERTLGRPLGATTNSAFADAGRPPTDQAYASSYNNYYEFGSTKGVWPNAQALPTDPWSLEVTGLVKNPITYSLEDLTRRFPLEERIYRFRCVEAWAMVVPWIGFPMRRILEAVEPLSTAKFARFVSYYDSQVCPGPAYGFALNLPWPYVEGLTVAEMANELAFLQWASMAAPCPSSTVPQCEWWCPGSMGLRGARRLSRLNLWISSPPPIGTPSPPTSTALRPM